MPRTPPATIRWRAVIDHSGLEAAGFDCRHGLSLHTFREHLAGSQPTSAVTPPAKFLPLTTHAEISEPGHSSLART